MLVNRQRAVPVDLGGIRRLAERALPLCLKASKIGTPLPTLTVIEATLLSDKRIASIHNTYFSDPTSTDVITFAHGEILVGASTAANNAALFGQTSDTEITLCIIHGLLHLGGWDDRSPADRAQMSKTQEAILKSAQILALGP